MGPRSSCRSTKGWWNGRRRTVGDAAGDVKAQADGLARQAQGVAENFYCEVNLDAQIKSARFVVDRFVS